MLGFDQHNVVETLILKNIVVPRKLRGLENFDPIFKSLNP